MTAGIMITARKLLLVGFAITIIAIRATDDEGKQHHKILAVERRVKKNQNINNTQQLNMTLCVDKCTGENCKSYITPTNTCYSSSELFPNDPSWSGKDLRDDIICQTLVRTIFDTENRTCRGAQDTFSIPLNECVGPFGKPRPWGKFSLAHGGSNKYGNDTVGSDLSLCEINAPGRFATKD